MSHSRHPGKRDAWNTIVHMPDRRVAKKGIWVTLFFVALLIFSSLLIKVTPGEQAMRALIQRDICNGKPCRATFVSQEKGNRELVRRATVEIERSEAMHLFGRNPYGTPSGKVTLEVVCVAQTWDAEWLWSSLTSWGHRPFIKPESFVLVNESDPAEHLQWVISVFNKESAANLFFELKRG